MVRQEHAPVRVDDRHGEDLDAVEQGRDTLIALRLPQKLLRREHHRHPRDPLAGVLQPEQEHLWRWRLMPISCRFVEQVIAS